ncbi:cation:proton antiporter [Fangia hongkongensis]|uniref:cation:proton antiporter n=1 Tax=Fangia hongkongensis TaxID=270495 RepID=UPI00035FE6F0|nr:sodium:proton antiporter [Fangia hongkongensis]MBK2124595.1 sodium:proton antiporter [Fangia hongkongensis]
MNVMPTDIFLSSAYIPIVLMAVLLIGFICQWLAWRLKLPAILFLLIAGVLLGPISSIVFGKEYAFLNPSGLFQDALYPIVSICVSIILFEGCLGLKFREIRGLGKTVRNIVSIGLLITAVLTTIAVHYIFGLAWEIAALIGAISSVSGPTVVVPILRSVRPTTKLANIIRWEGMLVDPIGAILAVIVYTAITASQYVALWSIVIHVFLVVIVGGGGGVLMGFLLGYILKKQWVPSYLNNMFVLSFVITSFVIAEHIVEGGGLLIVTIMGIIVGNMPNAHIEEILDFKESLSLILISSLFILLGANVSFAYLSEVWWKGIVLVLILQCIVRPIAAGISTIGSELNWRERMLFCWISPRGIVAAAVAALFSIKVIETMGLPREGELLVLLVFIIILGTVIIQSLTAPFLAKVLHASAPEPRGFLIIGGNTLARSIALILQKNGFNVVLTDTSWRSVQACRLQGLTCYYGSSVSEHADWHLNLVGIGRMLGCSSSEQMNVLSAVKYYREFDGRSSVFTLPTSQNRANSKLTYLTKKYAKRLFSRDLSYHMLRSAVKQGGEIKSTTLTDEYSWEKFQSLNESAIELFFITPKEQIHVVSPDSDFNPQSGWKVIFLLPPHDWVAERDEE